MKSKPIKLWTIFGLLLLAGLIVWSFTLTRGVQTVGWKPFDGSGSPKTEWVKTYDSGFEDHVIGIQGDSDGGCAVLGTVYSEDGPTPSYFLRFDEIGKLLNKRVFSFDQPSRASSLERTIDGGYLVLVNKRVRGTSALDPSVDLAYKLDSTGQNDWQAQIDVTDGWGAFSLIEKKSSLNEESVYYWVANTSGLNKTRETSTIGVIRLDQSGKPQWRKDIIQTGIGGSASATSDGGLIVVGTVDQNTESYSPDVYVLKIDQNGVRQWDANFGGDGYDYGTAIKELGGGGYIVGGKSRSFNGGYQIYLLKLDAQGKLVWEKDFGGDNHDWANTLNICDDGGFLLGGSVKSWTKPVVFGCHEKTPISLYVMKINKDGNFLWHKRYEFAGGYSSGFACLADDGGYFALGSKWGVNLDGSFPVGGPRDYFIAKINADR